MLCLNAVQLPSRCFAQDLCANVLIKIRPNNDTHIMINSKMCKYLP